MLRYIAARTVDKLSAGASMKLFTYYLNEISVIFL